MQTILYKSILLLFVFITISPAAFAQRTIPLYKHTIPNTTAVIAEDKTNADKSVFHRVVNPTLSIYLPINEQANNTAVIICAGGGYAELNIKREGYNIAEAFNKAGIAAFVLKHRLSGDNTNTNKTIAPLQDAQQALKMVRDSAAKWNIDKTKIGIMGFSAGGHLASSAGTHYNDVLIANASHTTFVLILWYWFTLL
jgi:acetyl esterase/lipase